MKTVTSRIFLRLNFTILTINFGVKIVNAFFFQANFTILTINLGTKIVFDALSQYFCEVILRSVSSMTFGVYLYDKASIELSK